MPMALRHRLGSRSTRRPTVISSFQQAVLEPSPPSIVEPYYGQPGGGTEITTENPIDVSDLAFILFGE